MDLVETQARARIVAAAKGWIGTPYHTMGRKKGVGVDCLTLLAEVYAEAGIIEAAEVPYYPPDWHLHKGEERYVSGVLRYAREMAGPPLPGDIALWRFGRCYSHGAIALVWPRIIHAYVNHSCQEDDVSAARWLRLGDVSGATPRPVRFFSVF